MITTGAGRYLHMLGKKARDKVTGIEGVVTSVSFDLYGCVQVILDCEAKEGERKAHWFDHKRLEVSQQEPVMKQPDWPADTEERGGFDKPLKQ